MNILQPEFYDKFECIGDKCLYHCCQKWSIIIDDATVEKYKTLDGELAKKAKNIKKTDKGHYCMGFDENGQCPFLDSKALCEIVKQKGPQELSHTCSIFPRLSKYTLDAQEKTLSIGCPYVGQLIKEIKSTLSFISYTDDTEVNINDGLDPETLKKLQIDLWIRDQLIDYVQMKDYPLWLRLYMGYLSLNVTNDFYKKNDYVSIAKIFGELMSSQGIASIKSRYIDQKSPNASVKFQLLQTMAVSFKNLTCRMVGKDLRENNKILESICIAADTITEAEYIKLCDTTKDFFKDEEYFLENVMVLLLFEEIINAYDDGDYLINNYNLLLLLYMLIKYYMQLYIYQNGSISEEVEIVIVSILGRCFMHGKANFTSVIKSLKESSWWNTPYVLEYLLETDGTTH